MFDTHCHLSLEVFEKNLSEIIKCAKGTGVKKFLILGIDYASSMKATEIADEYTSIYASVGVHPTTDLQKLDLYSVLFKLEELSSDSENVVAIGEIGLDYYHISKSDLLASRDIQISFFREQLRLSLKLALPVIVHNRMATEDVLESINGIGAEKFSQQMVFHCCPAEEELLDYAIKNKIFIGVDGDVTYDKDKQEFVKKIPLELLLLETDSPYLTPEPARSEKRFPNQPMNLGITAKFISEIKEMRYDHLVSVTYQNSLRLFNL